MQVISSLKNHLLIAMPQLGDSFFEGTVTYLCEHTQDGAMGLVLNRPINAHLHDVCEQLEIPHVASIDPELFSGGPVSQEHGFILHREQGNWSSTLNITEQTHLTSSKDILTAIASGTGPSQFKLALGYAGWDAKQLEDEILNNSWITVEATPELLFETPTEHLYNAALAKLGINADFLSSDAGHA